LIYVIELGCTELPQGFPFDLELQPPNRRIAIPPAVTPEIPKVGFATHENFGGLVIQAARDLTLEPDAPAGEMVVFHVLRNTPRPGYPLMTGN
jgi:hypothetical protein